jgi:hypothetical protein
LEEMEVEIAPQIAIYEDWPAGKDGVEELVVILDVLSAPINEGLAGFVEDERVLRVNGIEIAAFDDLTRALEAEPPNGFLQVELETGLVIRLDPEGVQRADRQIREHYGVD